MRPTAWPAAPQPRAWETAGCSSPTSGMCADPVGVADGIRSLAPQLEDLDLRRCLAVKGYDEMLADMNPRQLARLDAGEVARSAACSGRIGTPWPGSATTSWNSPNAASRGLRRLRAARARPRRRRRHRPRACQPASGDRGSIGHERLRRVPRGEVLRDSIRRNRRLRRSGGTGAVAGDAAAGAGPRPLCERGRGLHHRQEPKEVAAPAGRRADVVSGTAHARRQATETAGGASQAHAGAAGPADTGAWMAHRVRQPHLPEPSPRIQPCATASTVSFPASALAWEISSIRRAHSGDGIRTATTTSAGSCSWWKWRSRAGRRFVTSTAHRRNGRGAGPERRGVLLQDVLRGAPVLARGSSASGRSGGARGFALPDDWKQRVVRVRRAAGDHAPSVANPDRARRGGARE